MTNIALKYLEGLESFFFFFFLLWKKNFNFKDKIEENLPFKEKK